MQLVNAVLTPLAVPSFLSSARFRESIPPCIIQKHFTLFKGTFSQCARAVTLLVTEDNKADDGERKKKGGEGIRPEK